MSGSSTSTASSKNKKKKKQHPSSAHEVSHYVVTANPPGAVLETARCNFLAPDSLVRATSMMRACACACV